MAMPSSRSPAPPPTASSSYWCYMCDRFVRAAASSSSSPTSPSSSSPACPSCGGGFLEEMGAPPPRARRPRRAARRGADSRASPFNPVIVLRRSPPADADADGSSSPAAATGSSFELFYDDGAGSGLRPLPESMSDFLMGSGFERLLE